MQGGRRGGAAGKNRCGCAPGGHWDLHVAWHVRMSMTDWVPTPTWLKSKEDCHSPPTAHPRPATATCGSLMAASSRSRCSRCSASLRGATLPPPSAALPPPVRLTPPSAAAVDAAGPPPPPPPAPAQPAAASVDAAPSPSPSPSCCWVVLLGVVVHSCVALKVLPPSTATENTMWGVARCSCCRSDATSRANACPLVRGGGKGRGGPCTGRRSGKAETQAGVYMLV